MRDYVARRRNAPGVRSGTDIAPWPAPVQSRPGGGSPNNGGEYVSGRRELRTIYASRWLLALHDLDIDRYGVMLFEILVECSEEHLFNDDYFNGSVSNDTRKVCPFSLSY